MVVDDQVMVRAGLAAIVGSQPGIEVVGEAGDGAAAVTLAEQLKPDVILMDVRMPGVDGLTATARLTAMPDPPRVLVLTTFHQDAYVFQALRAGASGFLLKDAPPMDLVTAVRTIAAGEAMLGPAVTRRLIDAFATGTVSSFTDDARLAALTPRERDVLTAIAQGLSNAEIGTALGIGVGTVKAHVNALLGKIGARDRVQATIVAYDTGLVRAGLGSPGPAARTPPGRA
ncbi:response regulator [Actinoplanes derwentensis]|uniref:DNA-binding response regulator, NarL/FixJ family, contains REC and HTH domains n=1 Tax=Actinoplanes derwentensis TaxID=113562 RepID=A0A1H2BGN3_9ACTN|nr:response regulator transcription factor [Actinoplanes derwentensis]GID87794.1 DNA-binding response regulator [Actinoplanes derwentensis]SDT57247.1 DNA-binding response regulator, NarL/FixJ family, contains REC and HTH domains [Actinoplanes derwentensis]